MDLTKIDNIVIGGIDFTDVHDWCDCYIDSADYNGVPMTDEQLDKINEDDSFVYECVNNYLY
jgi:hypothetical protein